MSESGRVSGTKTGLGRKLAALFALLVFAAAVLLHGRSPSDRTSPDTSGLEIVQHGGYPELRIDGKPFFIHSAAFFSGRIPRDLWARALDRHRELGINTIDLYIPWNWHEPREGEFDFDGHTNPRRDLRALLKLIADRGFKLIARPGPVILNEWRHGGYPDWLLARPEYRMDLVDRLEGRYPPLSSRNVTDAEGAASGWLENQTHMVYAGQWLKAVAKELAPYSAHRLIHPSPPGESRPEKKGVSGPLLFVQLDDDLAIGRTNYAGPSFWRYMERLRGMLEAGGLDVPAFINPTDMRVSAAGSVLEPPVGVMGQWYLPPRPENETGGRELVAEDASTTAFYVEELKTQPAFPPILIEFQAGWYCPADDTGPPESPVASTLLGSRLLLANGLHGLNYFPAQDTYFPAGYEVPWVNRYYLWDAALDPEGKQRPRARALERNGQLIAEAGGFLAASHKRADFGLVYPLGDFPQTQLSREDILQVSKAVMQIERIAQLAGLADELLDPEYQPVEQLLRHRLVLLPVFDPSQPKLTLSERAQRALVGYVRRGGTVLYFPMRPAGDILAQLWQNAPAPQAAPAAAVTARWKFGEGQVAESSKDFYSWVTLKEGFSENLSHLEARWSIQALQDFLSAANVLPAVRVGQGSHRPPGLLFTELVGNEGTGLLGARTGGEGMLSVTNLNEGEPADTALEALSPRAGSSSDAKYVPVFVSVPPHESLLVPLEFSLCRAARSGEACDDAVVSAGAELVRAEREGKTLELSFYTRARASVRLRLERAPQSVSLEEVKPAALWDRETHELEIQLFRGASPSFLRLVKVRLPYLPHVPEKQRAGKASREEYEYSITNVVRLPLAEGVALASVPPLILLDENGDGKLLLEGRSEAGIGRDVDFRVEGPVHGSGILGYQAKSPGLATIRLRATDDFFTGKGSAMPGPDGLLRGTLEVYSGHDQRSLPIFFAVVRPDRVSRYRFDFDRDGAKEWVLENPELRLIVSPESGGRALALVEKSSGLNLTTTVGALRDHFAYAVNPPQVLPERARGRYGTFNRSYRAEWVGDEKQGGLRMSYDAPDVYPSGATIEKTVSLSGPDSLDVNYRVRLAPLGPNVRPNPASGAAPAPARQAFIAVNSVPALSRGDRSTRFCWAFPADSRSGYSAAPSQPDKNLHCEVFAPGRGTLSLPAGVSRLAVRTPGRPGLELSWEGARMTVEMKTYSALLKLELSPLEPGGEAGRYRVGFRVVSAEESGSE